MNVDRFVTPLSDSTSVTYDTTDVYVMANKEKLFYKFDTFSLYSIIIGSGALKDKPSGYRMPPSTDSSSLPGLFGAPKKATVNGIGCYLSSIFATKEYAADDTLNQQVLLIKNPKFNSFYKLNEILYPNKKYCIVGFKIIDQKNNFGYSEELAYLNPLSSHQQRMCERMIDLIERSKK